LDTVSVADPGQPLNSSPDDILALPDGAADEAPPKYDPPALPDKSAVVLAPVLLTKACPVKDEPVSAFQLVWATDDRPAESVAAKAVPAPTNWSAIEAPLPPEALTVRTNVAVPVPLPLVALNVTLLVPGELGVPLIAPVVVFTESPDGNPLAPKLVGLLLAVIW
jgi:hypothetical protein